MSHRTKVIVGTSSILLGFLAILIVPPLILGHLEEALVIYAFFFCLVASSFGIFLLVTKILIWMEKD